jgi:hypothetical protein
VATQVLKKNSATNYDTVWSDNDTLQSTQTFSGTNGMVGALKLKPANGSVGGFPGAGIYVDDGRYNGTTYNIGYKCIDLMTGAWSTNGPINAGAYACVLLAGQLNRITAGVNYSAIVAGNNNELKGNSLNGIYNSAGSTVYGGAGNTIMGTDTSYTSGDYNFVAGGRFHAIDHSRCTVFGEYVVTNEAGAIYFGQTDGSFSQHFRNVTFKVGGAKRSLWIGHAVNLASGAGIDGQVGAAENTLWLQTTYRTYESNAFGIRAAPDMTTKVRQIMPTAAPIAGDRMRVGSVALTSGVNEVSMVWQGSQVVTAAAGSALTVDFLTGRSQKITLTANCTLTFSNAVAGERYDIVIVQDTTPRTITWPASVKWPGGAAIPLTPSSGGIDVISLLYDGTNFYATYIPWEYTNASLTVGAVSGSWTTTRAVGTYYRNSAGHHRLRFNIEGSFAASQGGATYTISGVTFLTAAPQAFCGAGGSGYYVGRTVVTSNQLTQTVGTSATAYQLWGDVELDSKPTWVP